MIKATAKVSNNLKKNLMSIPLEIRKKVINGMTRAAAVSVQKAVIAEAPAFLKDSIKVTKRRMQDEDKTHYAVHAKGDKQWLNVMYEWGTLAHREKPLAPRTKRKPRALKAMSAGGGVLAVGHFRKGLDYSWKDSYGVAKDYAIKRINKIIKSKSK